VTKREKHRQASKRKHNTHYCAFNFQCLFAVGVCSRMFVLSSFCKGFANRIFAKMQSFHLQSPLLEVGAIVSLFELFICHMQTFQGMGDAQHCCKMPLNPLADISFTYKFMRRIDFRVSYIFSMIVFEVY
jgi:hypothetical protein